MRSCDSVAMRKKGFARVLLICLPLVLMIVLAILSTGTTALSAASAAYYYFPWYDSSPANGMNGNWILICNQESTQASVDVFIGGAFKGNYLVDPGAEITPQYPNVTAGPVKVVSRNGESLLVSQRVLYNGSFNEVIGVNGNNLDTYYYFPWYDSKPANGMHGNWILIANQGSATANVSIYMGNVQLGDNVNIAPGGILTPQFADTIGGPIRVVCNNAQPLVCSQRVLYLDSFNEVMGTGANRLDDSYNFTWYDSSPANYMKGNWILAANTSAYANRVQVCLSGICTPSDDPDSNLQPNDIMIGQFMNGSAGVMGPNVRVTSYDVRNLIASQRVLFKNSFSEVMGMPDWKLSSSYGFTWYDEASPGMRSWILVLNKGAAATNLQLCFEGECMTVPDFDANGVPTGDLSMNPGDAYVMELRGLMGGPLSLSSPTGVNLLASQRVTYWDSFEEIQGVTSTDTGGSVLPVTAGLVKLSGPITSALGGYSGPQAQSSLAGKIQVRRISGEQLNQPEFSALFDKP